MEEKPIIEEKSNNLEKLSICLRLISIVSIIIGLCLMLTNPNTNSNSTSISPGLQMMIDNMPIIEFVMLTIMSLIFLILAFITRKTPILAIIFLIIAIGTPLVAWIITSHIPQTSLIPAPQ